MKYVFHFGLFFLFLTCFANPIGYAKSSFPPPVEKVNPPVEKKKIKKRLKKKFRKKLRQNHSNLKFEEQTDSEVLFSVLTIILVVVVVTGLFLFGFGVAGMVPALWIAGLVCLAVPNFIGLIGAIILCFDSNSDGAVAMLFFLLFLILINLIGALVFFIGGLIAMNPLTWLVGIGLFLLLVLLIALLLVFINNSSF